MEGYCNYSVINGKGRLRESTHSRYTRYWSCSVLDPASVQLLPVCVYMAPIATYIPQLYD